MLPRFPNLMKIIVNDGAHDRIVVLAEAARLPAEYRDLILLTLKGKSYTDIAKIAAIPVGTVKSRISRARSALEAELMRNNSG